MNRFLLGDLVLAASDLYNDADEESGESAIPGIAVGELLVAAGTRGVIVNVGQVEALPSETVYLVRFEIDANGVLSEPFGCLEDELVHPAEPT
jgi:nitrogen fixation protein NifZ